MEELKAIDKVIEMCLAFRKDIVENGNEFVKCSYDRIITSSVTSAFYLMGYKKNGWINFSPYSRDGNPLKTMLLEIEQRDINANREEKIHSIYQSYDQSIESLVRSA